MLAAAALQNLMEGNARFVSGQSRYGPLTTKVSELARGQAPFATVLGCADSRVPVETVFDHEPGDIFVVRVAGNFLSPVGLGSIEYATEILKSPLVMVLGHTSCGAVGAAIDFVRTGQRFPGNIQLLADALAPAAQACRGEEGDWAYNAAVANVRMNVEQLRGNVHARVVGAIYNLENGVVTLLG